MGTLYEVGNDGTVDFQQKSTEQLVFEQGTVDPSGVEGQVFYRTDLAELRIHNGTSFQPLSAAAGGWQDTGVVVKLITNTDQVQIGDGSVGTPAFAFESETGTGIYREGSNSFDFAVAGTKRFELGNAGINLHGNIFIGVSNGSTSTLFVSHGSEAAPSLIFSNLETDTGFFRIGADNIGMAFEGTLKVDFNSSRTIFKNQVQISDGSMTVPSLGFENDSNTGIHATDNGTASTGTYTVVDFTLLAGDTVTVDGNVLTEGVEWTAATSNDATATSLASAIDVLGTVNAAAVTNVVTVTAAATGTAGDSIATLTSDGTNLTVSGATLSGGVDRADSLSISVGGVEVATLSTGPIPWLFTQAINANPRFELFQDSAHGQDRGPGLQFRGQYNTVPDDAIFGVIFGVKQSSGTTQHGNLLFTTNDGAGNNNQAIRIDANQRVRFNDGTEALPSITFDNDTNTGIFRATADVLAFSANGVRKASISINGLGMDSGSFFLQDGSASNPAITFNSDQDTGIYRSAVNSIAIATFGSAAFDFGVSLNVSSRDTIPSGDNTLTLGRAANRWSDLRAVLINGADYGFANGYVMREYPCTADDVQTKSADWMKQNANKGIQVLNDLGEQVCVIGRDGSVYAKAFKPLSELPV